MSVSIRRFVLLFLIGRGFCSSDSPAPQGDSQSGSSLSESARRRLDAERVIFDDEKTSKEGSSGRNKGQVGFNERGQDEKRYDEEDTARKVRDKGRHSLGEARAIDQGRNSFERHGNGYYKKGHRRTGFSNNYHKDESGNNSSFYEDSDDEGGHRSAGNSGGYYGEKLHDSFKDGAHDASYVGRDRARQGNYDNRRNSNDYRDYTGRYNNDRYKDDRRNYLQDEAGRYLDRNGRETYHYRERLRPVIYRNNDYARPFGYKRYYADTLPRDYYKEDPYGVLYSRDYRYLPQRHRDYDLRYPYKGHFDGNYRDDFYDNKRVNKYKHGFDNGYDRF